MVGPGLELSIRALIIMSPIDYGIETGLFNNKSLAIYTMKAMMQVGRLWCMAMVREFGVMCM